MQTTIQYFRHDSTFFHPDCPVLFGEHDTIGNLADCPFPLETDTFKVLLFGQSISRNDKNGHDNKFAVVEYKKSCGHTVQERITFMEKVEDFDHYGTKFKGAEYSIKDWQRRIEFFRTICPCDVCGMVKHSLWCQGYEDTRKPEKKRIAALARRLDYNFANWRDMTDLLGNSK